jgi:hypothetical protein
MDIEKQKLKRLPHNCFKLIVFFFRLAGVPFKMNKMTTIYAIYMVTVIFCTSSTFIGLILDVYTHRDDLGHIIRSMRVLIPIVNDLIIYFYCR